MSVFASLRDKARKVMALTTLQALRWAYWRWEILYFALGLLIFPAATGLRGRFGKQITKGLEIYNAEYFQWLIVGMIIQTFIFQMSGDVMSVFAGEKGGGIGTILFTPVDKVSLFLGMNLWNQILSFLRLATYFAIGALWFGLKLNINYGLAIVVFVFGILGQAGFGLLSQGMRLRFRQHDPTDWIIKTLSQFLCGTLFPVEFLPRALRPFSLIIPQTCVNHLARLAFLRGGDVRLLTLSPDLGTWEPLLPGGIWTERGIPGLYLALVLLILSGFTVFYMGYRAFKSGFMVAKKEGYLASDLRR